MRILIVTHNFFPAEDPRAVRWGSVSARWAAQGHEVDVVAALPAGAPPEEARDGVRIHRVTSWLREARASAAAAPDSLVRRMARRLSSRLLWPDYAAPWAKAAERKAAELMEGRALVTVSHPFTAHLVGLRLRERRPAMRWLADSGDPHCALDGRPRRKDRNAERRVLEEADVATVITAGMRDGYVRVLGADPAKIHVLPPLLSLPPVSVGTAPADGRIRLVFTGRLYPGLRGAGPLLRLYARLLETPLGERLELHVYGAWQACEAEFAPYAALRERSLFLHGEVPRARAVEASAGATALVNLGNANAWQLPSKVIEYGGLGKPILTVSPVPGDASAELLRTHPAAFAWTGDEGPERLAALRAFLERPPVPSPAELEAWLAPFRPERIADQYFALLSSCAQSGRSST